ncbi:MAG: T9SS type A sorting domain-containing protein [Saprospiraceae bacterium]|nr:T9SS type A sorting domain-containing protein [Saprospiraceae bacterium]
MSLTLNDGFNLPANLEIKDIFGKVLQSNTGHFVYINTSQLASGLYFITIRDSQGKISCIKKLIIQK